MMEAVSGSRITADLIPTGPTAIQTKDKANKAGTEGPPETAAVRAADAKRVADKDDRILGEGVEAEKSEDTREAKGSNVTQIVVESKLQSSKDADDAAADKRATELAEQNFAKTIDMTREAEAYRAEKMRIAM